MSLNESIVEDAALACFGLRNSARPAAIRSSPSEASPCPRIIAATVDCEQIKIADPTETSTRYRNYVPF